MFPSNLPLIWAPTAVGGSGRPQGLGGTPEQQWATDAAVRLGPSAGPKGEGHGLGKWADSKCYPRLIIAL